MATPTCPSSELLADYALGRVSVQDLERVAIHVDQCPECQAQLEALESVNDSFVSRLRQPLPDLPDQDSELNALIAQAEAIRLAPAAEASEAASSDAHSAPPALETVLPTTLGQYELLEMLGRGGMGMVYKARHLRLKRIVAVKVISPQRLPDPHAVARFNREMEAVGRLSHANIVQATDAGEAAGQHFLAMEFVDGRDLSQLVRCGGPLSVADACEIARQAALGLQHAHGHGLVHRDVKPSNLMVTHDGTVKLLDLGLALLLDMPGDDVGPTGSQQILGSPDFMAPEQVQDSHEVDARTDLYSLGCTLYYLLTARPPFASPQYDTRLKKVFAHVRAQPTPIQELCPDIPVALAELVTRLLAKAAGDRPQTAADAAAALTPLAAGHDLPGLVLARLGPTSAEPFVSQAWPSQAAASNRPSSFAPNFPHLRRTSILLGLGAVVVLAITWGYWARHSAIHTPASAANHEPAPLAVQDAPATGRFFFKGTPEGAVLRISGGPDGPILVDMDEQRSISLAPGNYRIEIERETKPHMVMQKQVTLEAGESATVVVGPAIPIPDHLDKTHSEFQTLLETVRSGNQQLQEENRRRDAEASRLEAESLPPTQ
ncbi:MAG: protein kinase [Planctomycetota bacterium]|nr:protein kinase [Planctomycetota bacterium]